METIQTGELERLKDSGDLVLVNVLGEEQFREEHIPDSINIPLDRIEEASERFDKSEEIVVYCASESCQASPKAAEKLEALGFENVKDYEPGMKGWKEAGNEVAS